MPAAVIEAIAKVAHEASAGEWAVLAIIVLVLALLAWRLFPPATPLLARLITFTMVSLLSFGGWG
jgi:hypothetical protein